MNNFVKVDTVDGLVRDMSTGAIINNNVGEYEKYIARRDSIKNQTEQIANHNEQINNINADLLEIKNLLLSIIEKNSNKG